MQLLFATSNPHKVEEVAAILAPMGIDVVGFGAMESKIPEPVEDGTTFQANARIKAVYYAKALGRMCLADDSGLEVDALGSAPGVHSARYAGVDGQRAQRDGANNEKLLAELQGVPAEQRTARFVCAMCLVDDGGSILAETRGTFRASSRPSREAKTGLAMTHCCIYRTLAVRVPSFRPNRRTLDRIAAWHRGRWQDTSKAFSVPATGRNRSGQTPTAPIGYPTALHRGKER